MSAAFVAREVMSRVRRSAPGRLLLARPWLGAFAVLALGVAFYRFSLITQGALAFSDELRYQASFIAQHRLGSGDVTGFFQALHSAAARPGYVLVHMLPAWIQHLLVLRAGMMPDNPVSLMVPLAFNAACSLGAFILFFVIARRLFDGNSRAAFFSALAYGLMANNTIYVRHILGCDQAMLLFLSAVYALIRFPDKSGSYSWAGVCAMLVFSVYPGYYYAGPFLAALAARECGVLPQKWVVVRDNSRSARHLSCFFAAAAAALLFLVLSARASGTDYFAILKAVSADAPKHQGSDNDFAEGFSFLPNYLIQVETFAGLVLLVLGGWYAAGVIRGVRRGLRQGARRAGPASFFASKPHFIILTGLAGYLIHSFRTYFLHDAVWQGRFLHFYMPFFVLAAVSAVEDVRNGALKRKLYVVFVCAVLSSFALFARGYAAIHYPSDVLYRQRINTNLITGPAAAKFGPWAESFNLPSFYCEQYPYMRYFSPGALDIRTNSPYTARADYVLVNFCFFSPNPAQAGLVAYDVPPGSRLTFEGRHFLAHPAYLYEGFVARTREEFMHRDYKIRIYENTA